MTSMLKRNAMEPTMIAAVALPDPSKYGFCDIIVRALVAFDIAIGPNTTPKQNTEQITAMIA